jgi:hypothetical protein
VSDEAIRCEICHGDTGATGGRSGPPDGAAFLCAWCGAWLIFDQHALGGARRPGIDEIARLEQSALGRRMVEAWQAHAQKGWPQ